MMVVASTEMGGRSHAAPLIGTVLLDDPRMAMPEGRTSAPSGTMKVMFPKTDRQVNSSSSALLLASRRSMTARPSSVIMLVCAGTSQRPERRQPPMTEKILAFESVLILRPRVWDPSVGSAVVRDEPSADHAQP